MGTMYVAGDIWILETYVLIVMQPFNAFLSGFSATVGQFVLTGMFELRRVSAMLMDVASLRIQTNVENKPSFGELSPERYGTRLWSYRMNANEKQSIRRLRFWEFDLALLLR